MSKKPKREPSPEQETVKIMLAAEVLATVCDMLSRLELMDFDGPTHNDIVAAGNKAFDARQRIMKRYKLEE